MTTAVIRIIIGQPSSNELESMLIALVEYFMVLPIVSHSPCSNRIYLNATDRDKMDIVGAFQGEQRQAKFRTGWE